MPLGIKSDEADRLARELAAAAGETITEAVTEAIKLRLASLRRQRRGIAHRLLEISEAGRDLPRIDKRTNEEILGYDEHGLPR